MSRRSARKLQPETGIKKASKEALWAFGWWCFPILQGLGAYPGISDIIAIRKGRVVFIEVKTPEGNQSPEQREFQRLIELHGGEYIIIRSSDEIIAWCEAQDKGRRYCIG